MNPCAEAREAIRADKSRIPETNLMAVFMLAAPIFG
jgi:hypothetical protein